MTKSRKTEVAVIGGGPAGLGAFLWSRELGLDCLIFESRSEYGGQLLSIYNPITNYPARRAADGREFRDYFLDGIADLDRYGWLNTAVNSFDAKTMRLEISSGEVVTAKSVIIATGVRRRNLEIPGEKEFSGRGILESGAKEKRSVTGKRVAIIGGGDAALENANMLADYAEKVFVIHRRDQLRGRPEFVASARAKNNVEFLFETVVSAILGNDRVSSLTLLSKRGETSLDVDAVLIRIGVRPNSELFRGLLDLDESGYVIVNNLCQTSIPGIYAVGDVADPTAPTIASAVGSGATAVKAVLS